MTTLVFKSRLLKNIKLLEDFSRKNHKKTNSETSRLICENLYLLRQNAHTAAEFFCQNREISDRSVEVCKSSLGEDFSDRLIKNLAEKEYWFGTLELSALPSLAVYFAIESCVTAAEQNIPDKAETGIKTLFSLRNTDFEGIISRFSACEKVFTADPAGVYLKMTSKTKAHYRLLCAKQAAQKNISEEQYAKEIVELCRKQSDDRKRHIGYYLFENSKQRKNMKIKGWAFIITRAALPFLISTLIGILTGIWWIGWFIYIPLHELLRPFTEYFFTKNNPVYFMPKMELSRGIPKEQKTLVTVPCLVPSPKDAAALCSHMEKIFEANSNGHINFCILADLKEASSPETPDDKARINALSREVKALNRRLGGRFILLVRKRVRIDTQNAFAGWERKRGAITELVRYIKTGKNEFIEVTGNLSILKGTENLIVLDSDTKLGFCSAEELVSAAAHPLNKPIVCPKRGIVTEGYGILAPVISFDPKGAGKNLFTEVMCGKGGISAYNSFCKNAYQDMLGVSIFSGKGLINIDAFFECLDESIPTEKILSHDILEGSYLRCGLCSSVEIMDGCPSTSMGYNDRQNRWIRGDFQNLLWLLPFINLGGRREKNPIILLNKIFLSDNITRALNPLTCLLTVIISAFLPYKWLFFAMGLLGVVSYELFELLLTLFRDGVFCLSQRYHSRVLPKAEILFLRAFFGICTLVNSAVTALKGAACGLYRQLFSKKRLLEWTTAADAEKNSKGDLLSCIKNSLYSVIIGIIMIVALPLPQRILGIFFVVCPIVIYIFEKSGKAKTYTPDGKISETLMSYITAMWQYFEDNCTEQNNYLPPDNIQKTPVFSQAGRTSPTNIGLMLLSALAVADLGIIDGHHMTELVSNTISSVEKLEKYHGNLINWYDIKTLRPLPPEFCSSVDSGNFLCCLYTLKNGLSEYPDTKELIERIEKIIEETRLDIFYDRKRELFSVGFDLKEKKLSNSYYDLLMSESRMMSYFAVASGQVPKRHWGALSRMLGKKGRYFGPLSWTGTTFEFFMPALLLPTYENTLADEALSFCIYCQLAAAKERKAPFGCSESGYYAFDDRLCYMYKANGIQSLGLKNGLSDDYVVSPYSSFLMLPFIPEEAMKNLKRLKSMGAFGQYGFYEALDFTPSRIKNMPFAPVRSFMAHHIGMSICAAENLLLDNILCKRFMRGEMNRADLLLYERIPDGGKILNSIQRADSTERKRAYNFRSEKCRSISPLSPKVRLLSNGDLTLCCTDSGTCSLKYGETEIYRPSSDPLFDAQGMAAAVNGGGSSFWITAYPDFRKTSGKTVEFKQNSFKFSGRNRKLSASMTFGLHETLPCKIVGFKIKNLTSAPLRARLKIYFEPCLANKNDFLSHPAFSRLFINSEYAEDINAGVFFRKETKSQPSVFLTAGFAQNTLFSHNFSREQVVRSPDGTPSVIIKKSGKNCDFGTPDPCFYAEMYFELAPFCLKETELILSVESDRLASVENFLKVREELAHRGKNLCRSTIDGSPCGILANRILSSFEKYHLGKPRDKFENIKLSDLWSLGISGDRPVVIVNAQIKSGLMTIHLYVKAHELLCGAKKPFDLCIMCDDGDYEKLCVFKTDGIFIFKFSALSENVKKTLYAFSVLTSPAFSDAKDDEFIPYSPVNFLKAKPLSPSYKTDLSVFGGYFSADRFVKTEHSVLPFSHILCTENFGTLLTDKSLGYTYAFNSREFCLTPRFPDSMAPFGGERLTVRVCGKFYDIISGATAVFSPQKAVYFCSVNDLVFRTTVFLTDSFEKIVSVDMISASDKGVDIAFMMLPTLSVNRNNSNKMFYKKSHKCLTFFNPLATEFKGVLRLTASGEESGYCVDAADFLCGRWDFNDHKVKSQICGALINRVLLKKDSSKNVTFTLSFCPENQKNHDTPPLYYGNIILNSKNKEIDLMFNTWLPHQIMCSRINGRTGFYQTSGAFGFRDQLQDCLAAIYLSPERVRKHILLCCSRQFEEGDVLHWWHELKNRPAGVRTRCSDDMLWLPLAVSKYLNVTDDASLLKENVSFLKADPLAPTEKDRYFCPEKSQITADVYEHCKRAFLCVRFSDRFLPLMGSCDWNDGFSEFGKGGESVWLAEFYIMVAKAFIPIAKSLSDQELMSLLKGNIQKLTDSLAMYCFEKDRYLRAFMPLKKPIGSALSKEDKIDLIPQAFAVLAGLPFTEFNRKGMKTAYDKLVDSKNGLIKLLDPPFEQTKVGYIADYPKGIRENGGQYTHAAVWFIKALFEMGEEEKGFKLIKYILPTYRCQNDHYGLKYMTEPYAVSADIYSNEHAMSRGGWSHYTGAAGWIYQVILENLLGVKICNRVISVSPSVPKDFGPFSLKILFRNTEITLNFDGHDNPHTAVIPLDGKKHTVEL